VEEDVERSNTGVGVIVLSILTATLRDRKVFFDRMMNRLYPQLNDQVELLIACDSGGKSLGEKMNQLYNAAKGQYVVAVNDDDMIPKDYVARILKAAESQADILMGKISQRWTHSEVTILERFENVLPAKRILHLKYGVWDEGKDNNYHQDSNLSRLIESAAETKHWIEGGPIYHHLRRNDHKDPMYDFKEDE